MFEVPRASLTGRGVRFDPVGGMQNHTAELTRALDREGVTQTVLTTRPPGAPAESTLGQRARVRRVGLPIPAFRQMWSAQALLQAPRLARHVDLVHGHTAEDLAVAPIAVLAAARHRLPLVLTVHCSLNHTVRVSDVRSFVLKTVGARIERWAEKRADAILTLTPRLADLLETDGIAPDSIHVVPSGVNPETFAPPHPDPFPTVTGRRVVFVGRVTAQKGVGTLVQAAARLTTPDVQVLLVGDGPHRRQLEREITELGLSGRVHVTGFVPHDQIPAVLAHAELFVLPSMYEEQGSALIEAMYSGLPIIASRVGGIPDVIDDGETGILVPPSDPVALAAAIDGLLSDRARTEELGQRARVQAKRYDWSVLARSVLDVYRTLVKPSGSG